MVNAGMQPREALREVEAHLTAAGCPDADFDAGELFRLVTGQDARLADRPLTAEQAAKLEALTARRATREPLQYLCGSWPFLDFELAVGPGVLCPRADTEVVAEAAAQMLAGVQAPKVLDLCAGTGCLGLGVKRFCPDAQVTCVEKSPEAFRYLEQNVRPALPGAGGLPTGVGGRAMCLLSGGNIDVSFIQCIIEQGLVSRHRRLRFTVTLLDRPGSLGKLLNDIAALGANILSVEHDRLTAGLNPNEIDVHVSCEVGGKEHGDRVLDQLIQNGYHVKID